MNLYPNNLKHFLIVLASIFLWFIPMDALPIRNPDEAAFFIPKLRSWWFSQKCTLSAGYSGDFVWQQYLKTGRGKHIDYAKKVTNSAYLSCNFRERVTVFSTIGTTQLSFNTSLGPFNADNPHPRFDFETATTFSWSGGARTILWKYQCWVLGIEGQYFSCTPTPQRLFIRANVDAHPDEESKRRYSEWHVGLALAYRYSNYFVPYGAVHYNRARWRFNNQSFLVTNTTATIPNIHNSKPFGFAVGATLAPILCEWFAISVEGRFGNEVACSVQAQGFF